MQLKALSYGGSQFVTLALNFEVRRNVCVPFCGSLASGINAFIIET